MPKMLNLASFPKHEACGQTVLPDRSILVGQTLVENAKITKLQWDISCNFQTTFRSNLQESEAPLFQDRHKSPRSWR